MLQVQVGRDRRTNEILLILLIVDKWCPRGCVMAYLARYTRA